MVSVGAHGSPESPSADDLSEQQKASFQLLEAPGVAPRQRLRLDIGYDGTDFSGWAKQPTLRTVQGEIEAALRVIVRAPERSPVLTVGGRTDTGVHARGQVAHVDIPVSVAQHLSARRINSVLAPRAPDIVVHEVTAVPFTFDARFSATWRRYEYRVADRRVRRDIMAERYTARSERNLDLSLMQRSADELLGLNDFTTFCKAREGATAVRDLLSFEWSHDHRGVCVARIEADAFCHSMVRAIVGATCAVGQGKISLDELVALRDARERTNRFLVMPAKGLCLEEIQYPEADALKIRADETRTRRARLTQAAPVDGTGE